MRYADSYQSIAAPDPDARWDRLTALVAQYVGKNEELDDVIEDSARIAHTINQELRYPCSASEVCDVAADAVYYAEHGHMP